MTSKNLGKIPILRLSGFFIMLIVITFFGLSSMAGAAEITYTGKRESLHNSPSWLTWLPYEIELSLFPVAAATPLSSGNQVSISYDPSAPGMTDPDVVFGGLSESEEAAGNSVALLNGQVSRGMYGGLSYYGDTVSNTVAVSGGSVGDRVYGGRSEAGDAIGNIVTFSGGSVDWDALGGYSYDGSITGNIVTIRGGSVGGDCFGGYSYKGNVTGNIVTISGGVVKGNVYGGWSRDGDVLGNSITVSGDSYSLGVFGGWSEAGSATGNTVTISGSPNLTKAYICGGYRLSAADILGWQTGGLQGDVFTGNTLNLKSSGISAKGVDNFEYYNFYLPQDLTAGGVMLSVADEVNLKGTTAAVLLQDSIKLHKGDKIALINSAAGVSNVPKNENCKVQNGSMFYEFSIYTDSNNLWAEVTKISNAAK